MGTPLQPDEPSGSELRSVVRHVRLLLALAFVAVAGAGVFAAIVVQKLNRVVVVVENVNTQVDRVVAAGAPLGKAAVEKGVKTLDAVDTDDLGKSATEGVKEIGRSAKERAIELIRQRRARQEAISE